MATATLIQGKVKYAAGTPKDFGHGDRTNILVTTSNGDEIKLWGKPTDAISNLKRGQAVQVIFDGKNHKLIELDSEQVESKPEPVAKDGTLSPDHKRTIAMSINQNADLLAFCLQTSKAKFLETGLIESEESMRSLATTLFIQAQKNL